MRVGMDISQTAHQGGVATYTKNLTQELSKKPDLEMIFFYSSLRRSYKGSLKNVKSYRLPPTFFEILFNRWRNVPIEKFIGNIDVFHSSDWIQPPSKTKKVTTYHDVVPLKYPQWSHPKIVEVHKRRLKIVEQEIDMVIAVSESTKRDLLEISQIPKQKITVINEAATADFEIQPIRKIADFKKKYNLPGEFVLSIGGIGERRNLKRVTKATKSYNLIVTGQDLPWLDVSELGLLYQAAKVLLYPSLYEGFGIPILDAFTCGLPVITSNISSMPEVGGYAAMYVDPHSLSDIEGKLKVVMEDKKMREEMIRKGFERVKEFSWEKCAFQTAEVYRNLLK